MKISLLILIIPLQLLSLTSFAQYQKWTVKACIDTAIKNSRIAVNSNTNKPEESEILLQNSTYPLFDSNRSGDAEDNKIIEGKSSIVGSNGGFSGYDINDFNNDEKAAEKRVIVKVLDSYLKVLYHLEQIEVANRNIETFQALLTEAGQLEKKGRRDEAELIRSEIKADADKFSIFDLVCELSFEQIALMEAMNIPLVYDLEVEKVSLNDDELVNNKVTNQTHLNNKEVRQVLIDHEIAFSKYSSLKRQFDYVEESFQKIQKKLKSGAVSAFELNMEKNNYLKTQSELLKAKYQFVFAKELLGFYREGMFSM